MRQTSQASKHSTIYSLLGYLTLMSIPLAPVLRGTESSLIAEQKIYDVFIFLLFVSIVVGKIAAGRSVRFYGNLFAPFFILFLTMFLSLFVMVLKDPAGLNYKDGFLFIKMLEQICLYWIVMVLILEKKVDITRAFLIIGGITIVVGFLQYLGSIGVPFLRPFDQFVREYYSVFSSQGGTYERIGGTFEGNPNNLGAYVAFFTAVFLSKVMDRDNSLCQKVLLLSLIAIGIIVVIVTLSRGALLNIAVGASTIILFSTQIGRAKKIIIVMIIVSIALLVVNYFGEALARLFTLKEFMHGDVSDAGFTVRLNIWQEYLSLIMSDPVSLLIGIGPSTGKILIMENYYLAIFVRYGLVGLVAISFLFFKVFRMFLSTLKKVEKQNYALVVGLFGGFTGMLLQCVSGDFFSSARLVETYWISFAIIESIQRSSVAKK